MNEPKTNLRPFFTTWYLKQCDLKKENYYIFLEMPHLFLSQIYTKFLIGFSYSSKPVSFRAYSMSFLNFLSEKTYLGKFSRPKLV